MRSRLVLPWQVQALKLMFRDDDEGLLLGFKMEDEEVVATLQNALLLGGRNGIFGTRATTALF